MRKSARVLVVTFLSLLATAVLGVGAALVATLALAATTALIVPGTGTPNANVVSDYLQHAADRYIAPFDPSCTSTNGCNLQGINYPASFFPLVILHNWCRSGPNGCDTWNRSVGMGVTALNTALMNELNNTTDNVVIFGYSQGGAVVSDELRNLGHLTPAQKARLQVVTIGNIYNPDGGLFTRLGFLPTIPILNVTFGPAMPTNTGIPITSIGFQYDPVMYAPKYWGNPFAMLNALAAFETVHGFYLTPNGNGPTDPIAYGYTPAELQAAITNPANRRTDSHGNVYVMIPAKSLPIADFVLSQTPGALQPVVKPVVDLVSPVWKVLADLGYNWSGDPGKVSFLSPLPFNPIQNWPAVGVNLASATVQGVQAFIGDLGGLTSKLAPATKKPTTTNTPLSTLAAAKATTSVTIKSTVKLSSVKDVTVPQRAVSDKKSADNHKKSTANTTTSANTKPSGTDKKREGSAKAAA
ncbi:MAG: hypothetical protein NVSMB60_02260 [Mycobacterium sp.]